ncbi:MAG: hypothetical protein QOF30_2038 [Acidimicrobiaceae bacterium]|nr:hypothetical protein [Acidimicrobiaceae bacterium]
MSESFRQSLGRKVVSRATAHELGVVAHLLPAIDCRSVAAIVLGRGKKAQLVDWDHVSGFGADAVMVADDAAPHSPSDQREQAAANGKLELLGKRTLSELGNELGTVIDVLFDPVSGIVEALAVAGRQIPADALVGAGSYAVVIDATQDTD